MCFYASWSLRHPTRDVSPIHWSDYTHYSERGHAEVIPKAFDAAWVPEEELYIPDHGGIEKAL